MPGNLQRCFQSLLRQGHGRAVQELLRLDGSSGTRAFGYDHEEASTSSSHQGCPWQQQRRVTSRAFHSSSQVAQDYYSVLSVARDASDQDIKKAYYKLAKQWHPDTNKGNPNAEKKFQEVQKAYETLRDPEKRRMYDQVGHENMERMEREGGGAQGFEGFQGGSPFGQADIFEHLFRGDPIFGAFFRGEAVVEQPIRISFMEAARGTKKRINLGGIPGMPTSTVEVDIPAGVDTNHTIQVMTPVASGDKKNQQRVRVLLRVEVEPHPRFEREGNNLHMAYDMPLADALLGKSVQVPTLDGTAELLVPPYTQNGDQLRLRGRGMPDPRGRGKGDEIVHIRVIKPRGLTDRQRELLKEFAAEEEKSRQKPLDKKGWFG